MTALLPFEAVLAAHETELYRFLRRLSPTAEDAADLHQETFVRAFRAFDRLPPDANVRAWLYRIAANLAHDAHRRRMVRAPHAGSLPDGFEPTAHASADPLRQAITSEFRATVRVAIEALPWRQRTAVVGRVFEGLDYAHLAAMLDCSEVTARQHVSQGLRRLRASLRAELEVPA